MASKRHCVCGRTATIGCVCTGATLDVQLAVNINSEVPLNVEFLNVCGQVGADCMFLRGCCDDCPLVELCVGDHIAGFLQMCNAGLVFGCLSPGPGRCLQVIWREVVFFFHQDNALCIWDISPDLLQNTLGVLEVPFACACKTFEFDP